MSKVIIYENGSGAVTMCIPTGELPIEAVLAKDCPENAFIVDRDALPMDDFDFYDAWYFVGNNVAVGIEKAREITKTRLRFERIDLLAEQDMLFQRALETGSDTSDIVAEKNRLRDLPLLADSCTTLDELRALKAAR